MDTNDAPTCPPSDGGAPPGSRSRWLDIFTVDLRALALMRVCLGVLIVTDLLLRARDLTEHYCDNGAFPAEVLGKILPSARYLSIHSWFGSAWGVGGLFVVQGLLGLLLIVGYRTRWVSGLSWVLMLSLHWRNPYICDGGDKYLLMFLFWGMFIPWHARFSVDAAMSTTPVPRDDRHVSPAAAAVMLQLALVYLVTAIVKVQSDMWCDGSAVSVVLQYEGALTRIGRALTDYPRLMTVLTYMTISFEFAAPILLFCPIANGPVRAVTLLALVVMHSAFGLCMTLGIFPLITMAGLLGVLPFWFVERLASWMRRQPVTIYYDGQCGFCKKSVLMLRTFLCLRGSTIQPAQQDEAMLTDMRENHSWIVRDADGQLHRRTAALTALFRASPIFRPLSGLLALAPVAALGDAVYRWIAGHRELASNLILPFRFRRVGFGGPATNAVATVFLLFMFYNAWVGVARAHYDVNAMPTMNRWAQMVRLDQYWNMYTQKGLHIGWVVMPGLCNDGSTIELIQGQEPMSWQKPDLISDMYSNVRREMWIESMPTEGNDLIRASYTRYLLRIWKDRLGDRRLIKVEMYFMLNRVFGDEQSDIPDKSLLLEWSDRRHGGAYRPGRSR